MTKPDAKVLDELYATILSRKGADPAKSYSAGMLAEGRKAIARKVGEEALETMLAAVTETRPQLASESADLLYHLLLLWAQAGLKPEKIWAELARRTGTSGIAEKAARKPKRAARK